MEQRTHDQEPDGRTDNGRWTPEGEGDGRTFRMGDFLVRWLPYARCWRGTRLGETLITASDLGVVMQHCQDLEDRPSPNTLTRSMGTTAQPTAAKEPAEDP